MDRWRPVLSAWAKTNEHQQEVTKAKRIVHDALVRSRRPYVAFSGGKDSTCLLHLVLQQAPDVTVLHWDYGPYYVPRWLETEFLDNARRVGARNLWVETSPEYLRLKRAAINILGREYLGKVVLRLKQEGYDLAFVGLRAEESLKRRRRIVRGESLTCIKECWPIARWSWKDVWAYIIAHGLPYASVYERYAQVVGLEHVRLTTFFDPEFAKIGAANLDGVLMWRDRHPE